LNELVAEDLLESIFKMFSMRRIYLSNVGKSAILLTFQKYAHKNKFEVRVVGSKKFMHGLTFAYEKSERLGVDRCLAMVGAYTGCGVLVVDAGSAITADYVSASGEHIGGYIFPGYEMSRNALLGKTEKIGVRAELGNDGLGRNTEDCVNNGFALMFGSMFAGLVHTAKELGINEYAITGGDAKMFHALSPREMVFYDNLVLDGLNKYALSTESVEGANL
jgi:type III pantothenate kinase